MQAGELICEVLQYLILIFMWIQLILNFTEVVALRQLQSDADMLLDILQKFSKQLFIRQLWTAAHIHKLSYFIF